jgi:hypothetical protein
MVTRGRALLLTGIAAAVTVAVSVMPASASANNGRAPSPVTTRTTPSTGSAVPAPPPLAPGLKSGPVRPLGRPGPVKLPAGVRLVGPVMPGRASRLAGTSAAIAQYGPWNIFPYTEIYWALDAAYQGVPTYTWIYAYNNSAAQQWYEAGQYNIDGYVGYAFYAYYGPGDMCANVYGNDYVQGNKIWVSYCGDGVQLNEIFVPFQYLVNGVSMYTLCPAADINLCWNVDGGIAPTNHVILWNLNEVWENSLWQFYIP